MRARAIVLFSSHTIRLVSCLRSDSLQAIHRATLSDPCKAPQGNARLTASTSVCIVLVYTPCQGFPRPSHENPLFYFFLETTCSQQSCDERRGAWRLGTKYNSAMYSAKLAEYMAEGQYVQERDHAGLVLRRLLVIRGIGLLRLGLFNCDTRHHDDVGEHTDQRWGADIHRDWQRPLALLKRRRHSEFENTSRRDRAVGGIAFAHDGPQTLETTSQNVDLVRRSIRHPCIYRSPARWSRKQRAWLLGGATIYKS